MSVASFACQDLVIGSGPGGAITACLLAEHGRDVILLEEGPSLPLESCEPFTAEEMLQKYRNGGLNPALSKPKIPFVEGRCVGGGSEINSGLYHRTPDVILEQWTDKYRVIGISPPEMEEHFRACEDALSVCYMPGPKPAASEKMRIGAENLGWHAMEVPRWFRYDGRVGPDGSPLGTRQSMTKTFVPRAVQAGARLMPGTRALKLMRGAGKGWSAAAVQAGAEIAVNAEHVFLCAGATQTPALLRRSGITRNVGDTLSMHPTVKVVARFPDEINHESLGVPVHQVKEFSPRISLGCAISSLPHLMLGVADYPGAREVVRSEWRHMAIYYGMITGPTYGKVRNVGRDAMIRYALSPLDLRDLARTLRYLSQLMFAAGAVEIYPSIAGLKPLRSPDELSTLPSDIPAGRTNLMTIHLFASCPMGEDKDRCAVDSHGRVHGVPGLSIHDASILCSAPGVNPQGSVMAFAHRNTMHYLRS